MTIAPREVLRYMHRDDSKTVWRLLSNGQMERLDGSFVPAGGSRHDLAQVEWEIRRYCEVLFDGADHD